MKNYGVVYGVGYRGVSIIGSMIVYGVMIVYGFVYGFGSMIEATPHFKLELKIKYARIK